MGEIFFHYTCNFCGKTFKIKQFRPSENGIECRDCSGSCLRNQMAELNDVGIEIHLGWN